VTDPTEQVAEAHRQKAQHWLDQLGGGLSNSYTQAVAMAAMAELDMARYLREGEARDA
jgi:hypothetical protein